MAKTVLVDFWSNSDSGLWEIFFVDTC